MSVRALFKKLSTPVCVASALAATTPAIADDYWYSAYEARSSTTPGRDARDTRFMVLCNMDTGIVVEATQKADDGVQPTTVFSDLRLVAKGITAEQEFFIENPTRRKSAVQIMKDLVAQSITPQQTVNVLTCYQTYYGHPLADDYIKEKILDASTVSDSNVSTGPYHEKIVPELPSTKGFDRASTAVAAPR